MEKRNRTSPAIPERCSLVSRSPVICHGAVHTPIHGLGAASPITASRALFNWPREPFAQPLSDIPVKTLSSADALRAARRRLFGGWHLRQVDSLG
jgi:hypothetical protein